MAQILTGILEETKILNALDTYNYTVLTAGMYKVDVNVSELPPSGMTVAIKQNGSTVVSSAAVSSSQQLVPLQTVLNCAINDVIGVTLSSSSDSDKQLNSIRAILSIHQGST